MPVKIGNFVSPNVLTAIFGFLMISVLMIRRIPGAILLGILSTTFVSFFTGVAKVPDSWVSLPPNPAPIVLQLDILGALTWRFFPVILTIFILDFLDTMATLIGLSARAGKTRFGKDGGYSLYSRSFSFYSTPTLRREDKTMENFDRTLVIDADGHVNEGDADIASWLPEKFRSLAPVRLRDNRGHPRMLLEGRIWPNAEGPAPGVSGPFTDKARKTRPGMTDPNQRLKDMDLEGIDVAVIFGTQIALTVNGLMNKDLAAALCHAVNEWMIDYCSADPTRLRAVGLIPCQDPPAAVRELQYLAKRGVPTAMLPNNVYGLNMGDPMFDPIFAAAQELDMPLCVHPQTGHDGIPGVSGVMGAGSERFLKYVYVHMTAFPFELMIAMMHMIGEGVFDRYPRLKVGFMEGGAGWLPFWMERLDEHVEKLAPQMPELKRRPSEIIQSEQVLLTCESEESGLDRVLKSAGRGSVAYASDYCHWDCRFPYTVKDILEAGDLTFAEKERILNRNAIEFFSLKNLPEPKAVSIAKQTWVS